MREQIWAALGKNICLGPTIKRLNCRPEFPVQPRRSSFKIFETQEKKPIEAPARQACAFQNHDTKCIASTFHRYLKQILVIYFQVTSKRIIDRYIGL